MALRGGRERSAVQWVGVARRVWNVIVIAFANSRRAAEIRA
jgi:hypothetical protein